MAVVTGSLTFANDVDGGGSAVGPVVTIGNFDGVHLGHRALVQRAIAVAKARGAPSLAYTFHPAPRDVLRPNNGVLRIESLDDRVARLCALGVDHVVVEPFDHAFAAQSPQQFAQDVLVGRLRASALVVGWDFRFGRGREGTADGLRAWLAGPVEQLGAVALGDDVVSSSAIREAVLGGDVALAARLLGRPHLICGEVVHGEARGRELGFPTANLALSTPLVPANGVYAVQVRVDDAPRWWPGVCNIGARPTFDGHGRRVEVHLLAGGRDLYGRELRVSVVDRLRDERAFPSRETLIAQIDADCRAAMARLERVTVTDDWR